MNVGGGQGHNDANANGALAMKNGGLYHEKDLVGDIAGALVPDKDGRMPFKHLYNAITACHAAAIDNKQTLLVHGSSDSSNSKSGNNTENPNQQDKEREPAVAS
jgi:hypothetical protein